MAANQRHYLNSRGTTGSDLSASLAAASGLRWI
jgi:hypothetical protein